MLGEQILHYRIISALGQGGMGTVYKAEDTRLGRFVALKFLSEDPFAEGVADRFLQEARAAARITHPNVCTIYDILESPEGRFIVMELVEGMTLRETIAGTIQEGGLLPVAQVVDHALQIGAALGAAHARGIVHRDIKSDNIMIDPDGRVRVMDFGLATLAGSESGMAAASAAGTLGYMPPELLRGDESDARGDIFSFGVVLHEALTGRLPFRGAHRAAMIYSVLNEEPQPVAAVRADVPDRLLSIISRALSRDPAARFASVDEMLAELSLVVTEGSPGSGSSPASSIASPAPTIRAVSNADPSTPARSPAARTELRIYISSSFGDLEEERMHLAGKIFPEIRALCRQRGIGFTEIDLRWGLAEEELQGEAIRTSLQEIDRCRPYFIGIVGDRYGRALELHRMYQDPELIARHAWIEDAAIDGASLLEAEFMHGALHDPKGAGSGAGFFFRRRHRGDDDDDARRLDTLEERIRDSGLPLEHFREPVALGEMVYERLLEIVERDFPAGETLSDLDRERLRHEVFAASRRQAYIPNPLYLTTLNEFVESAVAPAGPLVVQAISGAGKSALLAFWCRHYRRRNPSIFLIEHYVGIGAGETGHLGIIRHVMLEIRQRFSLSRDLPQSTDLEIFFGSWLAEVRNERLIIVLDGLNHLEGSARALAWLSAYLPSNIRVIVSTVSDQQTAIEPAPGWPLLRLEPLSEREREAMIVRFLSECHKTLSPEMVETIAGDPKSAHPLFLRTVMEEVRLIASQQGIESTLGDLLSTRDSEDLFKRVLERLERDFTAKTVAEVMMLIWGSRSGLTELELASLTGISRLKLSSLLIALDYHLIRTEERLRFFHDYLRRAVETRYLADEESRRVIHARIADYLQSTLDDAEQRGGLPRAGTPTGGSGDGRELQRTACDLLWHLRRAGTMERLKEMLSRPSILNAMAVREQQYEMLGYWLAVGGFEEMESTYNALIDTMGSSDIDVGEQIHVIQNVAHFYRMAGLIRSGVALARRSMALHREIHGYAHQFTWESTSNLAILLRGTEAYDEAEALYRELLPIQERELGAEHKEVAQTLHNLAVVLLYTRRFAEAEALIRRSLVIREKALGPNDPTTASSYANLAGVLISRGEFIEATQLQRRVLAIRGATQGTDSPVYATALANLGTTLIDHHEWEEAERLLRRALEIREATLGASHPEIAHALHNLAATLRETGRLDEAEATIRRAVEIRREVLGEQSQDTMQSLNNLAVILLRKGERAQATEIFRDLLERREALRGPDHPLNAHPLIGLGAAALAGGDIDEAMAWFERALRIRENALGPDHADVAQILPLMARVAAERGAHDEARRLIDRAIAIRTRAFGTESPAVAALLEERG